MRTTIRGAWLTAFPTITINHVGFGTVIKLSTYADPTAYLPDEVEDYISIRFKKVTLRFRYTSMESGATNVPLSDNEDIYPIIYQCRPGDTVPTSYDGAKAVGTTIEENVNSGISGDGPRGMIIGAGKTVKYQPVGIYSTSWIAHKTAEFKLDVTKQFQDLLLGYQQGYTLALDSYVLMYGESGQNFSLNNLSGGDYWALDIEWDFKSGSAGKLPNANTKVNRTAHPVIRTESNLPGGFPRKWYQWVFPWL